MHTWLSGLSIALSLGWSSVANAQETCFRAKNATALGTVEFHPSLSTATLKAQSLEAAPEGRFPLHLLPSIEEALFSFRAEGRVTSAVTDGVANVPSQFSNNMAMHQFYQYVEDVFHKSIARLHPLTPDRKFSNARVDLRWSEAGWVYPAPTPMHVDGGFATIALTLVGPATIVDIERKRVQAPTGIPVIMIGSVGAKELGIPGLYHESPPLTDKPQRLFLQVVLN